jgi:hypothetical protein
MAMIDALLLVLRDEMPLHLPFCCLGTNKQRPFRSAAKSSLTPDQHATAHAAANNAVFPNITGLPGL